MVNKKALIIGMSLLLIAGIFFFGGRREAPEETGRIGEGRTLVVGVWGGPQEEIVREHVVKPFEEETGATVELILGGSGDRFARLVAEKDNPTFDVAYINLPQTIAAARDGLIQPPNPEGVPEYNNLYPQAKEPGGYGVAFLSIGIMANTAFVDEADMPTSWKDLWRPEFQGKVAPFVYPGTQGEAFLIMSARAHGGGEGNIDPGFEALQELKPFPAVLSGVDETNLAFRQGDVWFTPQIHGLVNTYQAQGGDVTFIIPKEGAPLAMNNAVIPINSPNADLAEIFINYHLSEACMLAYAERLYYSPTNMTIELPEEIASRMPYGPEEVGNLIIMDYEKLDANRDAWTDRWNREVLR